MVRDLAERDQAARAMSLMMACTSIAPMLAPLIGGQILWFLGWRAIFWVLAGIGVVALTAAYLRLPRPAPEYRQPLVLRGAETLRRAVPPSRLHGLRLHQHLHVLGLLSSCRARRSCSSSATHRAARLRSDLRRHGRVHDLGSLLNAKLRRCSCRQDPALRGDVPAIAGPAAMVLGFIEARYGTIGMWPFLLVLRPQIAPSA